MKGALKRAKELLDSFKGKELTRADLAQHAIELANLLLEATIEGTTRQERKRQEMLAKMISDPKGRLFLTKTTDQAFRSSSAARTADQLVFLMGKLGTPRFLKDKERIGFLLFKLLGPLFPNFFVPLVKKRLRDEMAPVLLPEDPRLQQAYFKQCKKDGIRINLNHLGEAILGENEALKRLDTYLDDLSHPDIDYISVKISSIFSQINLIGWEKSLDVLSERLRLLYRAAIKNGNKFVNLDMEEYKDLELTISLFQKILSEPEFFHYEAGIVLQSYIPDSYKAQQRLTEFALERVKKMGSPIKIRLVKGANLAMETLEASMRGWRQAPFEQKEQADANFKRMLEYGISKERADATHIGVGSHNLFDISYALILRHVNMTQKYVSFEMLKGMAEPMQRVIKKVSDGMLLYCPEAKESQFQSAVAYLIRRLDENCGPDNFLRYLFEITPQHPSWNMQTKAFLKSCTAMDDLSSAPRHHQDRNHPQKTIIESSFMNEPDTDFSLPQNRLWASSLLEEWKIKKHPNIPLVIAGDELTAVLQQGIDPSEPNRPLYIYSLADESLIDRAIACAKEHETMWGTLPCNKRSMILAKIAQELREKRKDLIGAMVADGGKTIWEADPEVSEAIDFLEYYRRIWEKEEAQQEVIWKPLGTVLVAPPWNFPCSIPTGGIAAALMTGNCVIFKPAPEAILVGWHLVQAFWRAGVPKEVLQFVNCVDEPVGSYLVKHSGLSAAVLTGATSTARKLLKLRPGLMLIAETGGKNAMILTALCDRDLAIKDLLQSAFGHAGQKCSACSLGILERELYEDAHFLNQLKDAAKSLAVGSAWDPFSKITPLIRPPEGPLLRGLTQLEEGEKWLLEPKGDPQNPHLWSPGIKLGVKEGGYSHQTELFGPVLSLMCADSLDEAIRFANGTPYGLTSGLHSLDEREQQKWKNTILAGNLYINRGITGAIVQRQPFGGYKDSIFGPGAKAGGPNYMAQLAHPSQGNLPNEKAPLPCSVVPLIDFLGSIGFNEKDLSTWKKSAENYAYWASILKLPQDPSKVLGQDNFFYHVNLKCAYLRIDSKTDKLSFLQTAAACLIAGTPLEISTDQPLELKVKQVIETDEQFINRLPTLETKRIRLLAPPSDALKIKASELGLFLQTHPVIASGRIELLHYLREVSLSNNYHRYGYIER